MGTLCLAEGADAAACAASRRAARRQHLMDGFDDEEGIEGAEADYEDPEEMCVGAGRGTRDGRSGQAAECCTLIAARGTSWRAHTRAKAGDQGVEQLVRLELPGRWGCLGPPRPAWRAATSLPVPPPRRRFNDGGVPFEPFHLKREREEGYFDEARRGRAAPPGHSLAPASRAWPRRGDAVRPAAPGRCRTCTSVPTPDILLLARPSVQSAQCAVTTPAHPSPPQAGNYVEFKTDDVEDAWADELASEPLTPPADARPTACTPQGCSFACGVGVARPSTSPPPLRAKQSPPPPYHRRHGGGRGVAGARDGGAGAAGRRGAGGGRGAGHGRRPGGRAQAQARRQGVMPGGAPFSWPGLGGPCVQGDEQAEAATRQAKVHEAPSTVP